jgi:hypothetical protein
MLSKLGYLNILLRLCFSNIVLSLLTSCAGTYQAPSSLNLNKSDTSSGIVLYSISVPKSSNGSYYIDIFHIESRTKERLFMTSSEVPVIKNDEMKVYYFTKVLPQGDYKIFGWGVTYNFGYGTKTYTSRVNISIPFTVQGDEINYLGDYFGVIKKILDGGGLKVPIKAYFIVSNRFKQDINLINKRLPNLNLEESLEAIPDFAANNTAYSGFYLKGINVP